MLRVKRKGEKEYFVGRRYGDFSKLYKDLRLELPGKVLPVLPKKNKTSTTATGLFGGGDDSEVSSISSASVQQIANKDAQPNGETGTQSGVSRFLSVREHRRTGSSSSRRSSPRRSVDGADEVCGFLDTGQGFMADTFLERYALPREPEDLSPRLFAYPATKPTDCSYKSHIRLLDV